MDELPARADAAGASIAPLLLKSGKQTKKSVKLAWKKQKRAVVYVIYGAKAGKKRLKQIGAVTGSTFTATELAKGKGLAKGVYYKFAVVALDSHDNVVSTSKAVYVATKGKLKKAANPTKVKVAKPVLKKARSLVVGAKLKLKAKVAKAKGTKVVKKAGIRYQSSRPAVASVTKAGVVKAKSKGKAKIYCYAQNGKLKTVT